MISMHRTASLRSLPSLRHHREDMVARVGAWIGAGFLLAVALPAQTTWLQARLLVPRSRNAMAYDVARQRTLEMLKEHGWSPSRCIPHGGHQMSLNIAAGLGLGGNETYPDVFQPFGGFADLTPVEDG